MLASMAMPEAVALLNKLGLRSSWGSDIDQTRIFDAVASSIRDTELPPLPPAITSTLPTFTLGHALDLVRH